MAEPLAVTPLRVLLCDDSTAFSVLVGHWLADDPGIEIVGTPATVDEGLGLAGRERPDVIVLDHLLGSDTSATVAPAFRECSSGSALLLISGLPEPALADAAAACQADAYLTKSATPDQFGEAIRRVALRRP